MSGDIRIWQGGWFVSWEMARLAMNRYGEECSSRMQEPPLVSLLPENLPKTERARRKPNVHEGKGYICGIGHFNLLLFV